MGFLAVRQGFWCWDRFSDGFSVRQGFWCWDRFYDGLTAILQMLLKQRDSQRQSMILMQNTDTGPQLQQALEQVAHISSALKDICLQHQNQVCACVCLCVLNVSVVQVSVYWVCVCVCVCVSVTVVPVCVLCVCVCVCVAVALVSVWVCWECVCVYVSVALVSVWVCTCSAADTCCYGGDQHAVRAADCQSPAAAEWGGQGKP